MKKTIAAILLPFMMLGVISLNSCRGKKDKEIKKVEMEQKNPLKGR